MIARKIVDLRGFEVECGPGSQNWKKMKFADLGVSVLAVPQIHSFTEPRKGSRFSGNADLSDLSAEFLINVALPWLRVRDLHITGISLGVYLTINMNGEPLAIPIGT